MLSLLAAVTGPIANLVPTTVPEPTDFALFGLAIAGLVIGRQSSKKPPKNRDDNA